MVLWRPCRTRRHAVFCAIDRGVIAYRSLVFTGPLGDLIDAGRARVRRTSPCDGVIVGNPSRPSELRYCELRINRDSTATRENCCHRDVVPMGRLTVFVCCSTALVPEQLEELA